ncbi:MAG: hypothetical protein JNN05_04895, partial [Candidatus Omnitrophica bacterium]|nr:hypothetical protein [Candidatus Omnitrophota bacterium]
EGRTSVTYQQKPLEPAEQKIRDGRLVKAYTQVLAGILKREPTQEELLGLVDISFITRRKK